MTFVAQSNDRLRSYEGAVAVVTGGASGIGQALVEALADRGAIVVIADLQGDRANTLVAGIHCRGCKASATVVDVADFPAMHRLINEVVATHGRLDYLFNNAGIGIGGEVEHYQIEDWYRIFDVNLRGVANGVQAAYPIMLRQGYGHIVNTASMAGLVPFPWTVNYSAAKHGVVALSLGLRMEAAPAGVRVSVLCPGVVRTPILENGGKYGKLLQPIPLEKQRAHFERMRPMDPAKFARKALRAVARNRAIIVFPAWWKIIWWLYRLSPGLWERAARNGLARAKKSLASGEIGPDT
jgi:NAD(P)-dependent dehydrogenase (short-subunit alcohol dehydrogenase family)